MFADPTLEKIYKKLNSKNVSVRLSCLAELKRFADKELINLAEISNDVNNHIHTNYSFSPYSPSNALWHARLAGLSTAGIMDHDTIAGAKEFLKAANILKVDVTCGLECRVSFEDTSLNGRRINNPDQDSVAYMALHGIPHQNIDYLQEYFSKYRALRNERNEAMVDKLNTFLKNYGIKIDFYRDIVPLSLDGVGGTITERHICFGLAHKIISKFGKGVEIIKFLENICNTKLSEKAANLLSDCDNPHYDYDLLGVLKSIVIEKFYIPATDECAPVREILELSEKIGAISAYAYLGDVTASPTGDKKAQTFEDSYLEELFIELKNLGFRAITYMPSRNTAEQIDRLKALCKKYDFFEICGEDINQPRQSFVCTALRDEKFDNLRSATWAMIAHERLSSKNLDDGLFSKKSIDEEPDLTKRVEIFAKKAKEESYGS